jgi:hypothetical protein
MTTSRIDAHIIRVIAERYDVARAEIDAAEEADFPVAAVRDDNEAKARDIADTLRLSQTRNPVHHFLLCKVDDIESVVAQFRNKQAVTDKVDRKMINAP